MFKWEIIGNLGRDSELSYTPQGTAALKFTVAAEFGYGERKQTAWATCTLFGDRGEKLAQYLVKGTKVFVRGEPNYQDGRPRTYENKEGETRVDVSMTVQDLEMLGGKKKEDDGQVDV
jgi:single-strand DNA-binding protein